MNMDALVMLAAVFAFSAATAILRNGESFSINIFLSSAAIGITLLIWMPVLPTYMIVLPIAIIVSMMFQDRIMGSGTTE